MLKYAQYTDKLYLESGQYGFHISLSHNFPVNKVTKLPYRHMHAKYEVIFVHSEVSGRPDRFIVTPPLCEHSTYYEDNSEQLFATSFQFSIQTRSLSEEGGASLSSGALENFLYLSHPVVIEDSFCGGHRIASVRRELREKPAAYFEVVQAELALLLVELARRLPLERKLERRPPTRSLDEIRLDVIDNFFIDNCDRPDCKREDLSRMLCISERQLSRILEQSYGMSFRERLLRTRMEVAEALRKRSAITAECLSEQVGYTSPSAFLAAYRSYFGCPFKGPASGDE